MEARAQGSLSGTSKLRKNQQQSPLEASTGHGKCFDPDWRYLLARIYQNINGSPVLKRSNSSKLVLDQECSVKSDSTSFKCNCRKTRCLKLYCQCFAKGQYCIDCNCQNCNNTPEYDVIRSNTIDQIIQKNPNAFDSLQRTKLVGCVCKKTGCLKKYCQCFNIGKKCGQECKCVNCLNVA